METRALAIAFFYAIGTAIGGVTGPYLFGKMIESGEESQVAIAFFIGAGVMALGGIAEIFFGVKAEQAELEDIAKPLTAQDAEGSDEESRGPVRRSRDLGAGRRRRREQARRYRLGPGRSGSSPGMAVSAPITEQDSHARGRADRAGAGRARPDRAARAGAARRRPLLGPGPVPGGAARGGPQRPRAADRPHALRAGRAAARGRFERRRERADRALRLAGRGRVGDEPARTSSPTPRPARAPRAGAGWPSARARRRAGR